MLFGYPIAATQNNWLHDCLCETLQLIHIHVDRNKQLPAWPEILPQKYRERLKRRSKLKKTLEEYHITLVMFDSPKRQRIFQALKGQNKIDLLLSCQHHCETVQELPEKIREPVINLFSYAFTILTDLEIRDRHYYEIYNSTSDHICPFCGSESFDAPGAPREALDHYLPEVRYPFAASNLRNLVPMGNKCNSRYKLAQDILRRDDGTRRKSFDPYAHPGRLALSLSNSEPFAGNPGNANEPLPRWQVDFEPESEEITTWNDVFRIEERYKRDILDAEFNAWLRGFRSWCIDPRKKTPTSDQEFIDAIEGYANYHSSLGFSDRAFLKAAVFRMLCIHCKNGNQRLLNFIRNVVMG
jgi:hypothetical protein